MEVTLHPGETLAGKYRIERELGAGGMASVFQVMHLQLGERAAIKLLRSDVAHVEGVVERFSREAKAMSRLKSEHVARVQDVGKLPSGQPYMVMEYLEGTDLSDAIQARGVFATQDAVDLILQACEAIAEAHARGIVHRDLKPSNLFLTNRTDGTPVLKVLDFGISKISAGPSTMSLTQTQALLGSPLYMAPEQIASARDADERADLWGIGTVLYEMLAGEPPFYAETLRHLQYKILNENPPSIRVKRPDVPEALEAVLRNCLEKKPEARFDDMGELARALEPFATVRGRPYADRVCSIVSRAHTLAAPSGQRTARLKSVDSKDAVAAPPPETMSLSEQIGHEPTFDISNPSADAGSEPGTIPLEGTHGAWGGSQKQATSRSRAGLIAAGLVGIAALAIIVLASVRYLSSDARATASSSPASAPTIEPTLAATATSIVEPPALVTSVDPEPSATVASAEPDVAPPRIAPVDGRRSTPNRPPKTATGTAPVPTNGNAGGLFDTRK